jgi:hypothetical protein
MAPSIALTENAAATLTLSDVETWLKGKFDGTHPEVGAVDAATLGSKIFVLYYPAATSITADGGAKSCRDFTGFHDGVTLASGAVVSYVVMPRCMATAPQTQTEELVLTASGLIVSTATNPVTSAMPSASGYEGFDKDHGEWAEGGNDVGTACGSLAPVKLSDIGVTVSRTWSNAAALAYHDPCIPVPDAQPYFVAAPVQTDDFAVVGLSGKGVKVPKGGSAKVPLQLLSDAPTSGAWSVTATDLQSQSFALSVAPMSGQNGDVLELTITDKGSGVGSLFVVTSTLGTRVTFWYGYAFVK